MTKTYGFWKLIANGILNQQLFLKQMTFLYFIMILICLFDSETQLIAHDFIKQNSQHGKINLIPIFFIFATHTVLNNTISTQILQDKLFKYYVIHNIISDSTQHNLFFLIKHINPRGLDGLKECYWHLIYFSAIWFTDLLIYYFQVTKHYQNIVGSFSIIR